MRHAANTPSPTARSRGTSTRGTADRLAALCQRLWVVGAFVLGVVVVEAVALGAVVLGTVPAGTVVGATPTGAVVVDADAGGDMAEVPGARGARAADCPTTTPTDVLAPRGGWLPSRLASGRLATASTVVTAPIAIASTTAAATAIRCQRIGWAGGVPASASLPTLRTSVRRSHRWVDASEWAYPAVATAMKMLMTPAPARVPKTPKKEATTAPLIAASAPPSRGVQPRPHGIATLATKHPLAPAPAAGTTRHPGVPAARLPVFS
jgi:hypothetical protein